MSLSLFILGLYIFLQSAVYLAWFAVDAKLLGFVGIAFVVVTLLEAFFLVYRGRPLLTLRRKGE